MGGVMLPLHMPANAYNGAEYTQAQASRVYAHWTAMMRLNPQGFRTPPGGKPAHRRKARKPSGTVGGRLALIAYLAVHGTT